MNTLKDYSEKYLGWAALTKAAPTVRKERAALRGWCSGYGDRCLEGITASDVDAYAARRRSEGASPRTVNLDVISLGNLFKRAVRENLAVSSPAAGWEPLRHRAPQRPLWSLEQIESVVEEAAKGRRGQTVVDYLRLLAYSGARRQEAIELCWSDVDFERRTVHFHRATKYGKARTLDMNPRLESHLREMFERRVSSRFLFPGAPGQPARSLVKSIARARKAAGLPELRPHDLRHAFISRGVMAGVDWITLAQWAGHSDGGVLIGKVYGHLSDEHRKKMAEKV